MKCQSYFLGKLRITITSLSSAEFANTFSRLKVNYHKSTDTDYQVVKWTVMLPPSRVCCGVRGWTGLYRNHYMAKPNRIEGRGCYIGIICLIHSHPESFFLLQHVSLKGYFEYRTNVYCLKESCMTSYIILSCTLHDLWPLSQ